MSVPSPDSPRAQAPADRGSPARRAAALPAADAGSAGRALGIACAALVVALFSSFTLVSRLGLTGAFSVLDLAALRFGIGGALLLPVFARFGLAGLSLPRAASLAVFGGVGFALLAYAGFRRVPSSHAAVLLHGTLPFFGALCGALILGQSFTRRLRLAIGVIALGIVAIGAARVQTDALVDSLVGDALLLAASASWSVYGALLARWRVDARAAAAVVAALSLVMLWTYLLAAEQPLHVASVPGFAAQALFQGVLIGVVSLFVYSQAVRSLGATTVALATAAVPPVTALGAIPLLGEWPGGLEWTGVALALAGTTIALYPSTRKGPT
jgi:drug/metabolite transporter (DMT)-like permease